jgi:hypothetical protein
VPMLDAFATMATLHQGCQMVYFQAKNPNLGKFWRVVKWKMFGLFKTFWSILRLFGIFCSHLVCFVAVWYILWSFNSFFPVLVCCT